MSIVLTGAAGRIGRLLREQAGQGRTLRLLDIRRIPEAHGSRADLSRRGRRVPLLGWSRRRRWERAFEGADCIVHLAGNPEPAAEWREVLRHNVVATRHVIDIAAECGVGRIVFASSNFAVRGAELELAPDCYEPDGPKIGSDCPPRPITAYGISKAVGEVLGREAVDSARLRSFVAVRIGCYALTPPGGEWRRRWVGARDLATLLWRCVDADFEGFQVVYAVSGQVSSPYDLSRTRELLSWAPEQSSDQPEPVTGGQER